MGSIEVSDGSGERRLALRSKMRILLSVMRFRSSASTVLAGALPSAASSSRSCGLEPEVSRR